MASHMAHNASSNAQDTLAFLALPWHKADDCHRGVRIARQDYPPVALVASAKRTHTHTHAHTKLQGQRWQNDFYYFAHVLMTTCSPRFSALLCICLEKESCLAYHAHKKQAERGRPPPPQFGGGGGWMLLHAAASLPDLEHPPESLGDMSFSEKIPSLAT